MLEMGSARPSSSCWSAALPMVPKKTGDWRQCGSYRALSIITVPEHYPLLNIQHFTANLCGATIFSWVNLAKAYHQIFKTAIATPFGSFEFTRMPFGLWNVVQTFQWFMDVILHQLPSVYTYVNDILLTSSSLDDRLQHLGLLFECLWIINADNCKSGVASLKFLGHLVDSRGI